MTLEDKINKLRLELDLQTEDQLTKALSSMPERIEGIINKRIEDIVAGTLGFENRWGRWEINNTNGRQTEAANAVGRIINEKLDFALNEWTAEALKKGTLPKGWKEAARKEFDERVDWHLRELIREYAKDHINQHAEKLLQKVLEAPPAKARAPKREREYDGVED
jgi:hypothetical protein